MKIYASYPISAHILFLPEPHLSNAVELLDERKHYVMMSKHIYSYIKRSPAKKYSFTFSLSLEKMFELDEFILAYTEYPWRITSGKVPTVIGYCVSNPSTFTIESRANRACSDLTYNNGEKVTYTLEVEG